jgi:hypothetical protein
MAHRLRQVFAYPVQWEKPFSLNDVDLGDEVAQNYCTTDLMYSSMSLSRCATYLPGRCATAQYLLQPAGAPTDGRSHGSEAVKELCMMNGPGPRSQEPSWKLLERPKAFSGKDGDWQDFKFAVSNWLTVVDARYEQLLDYERSTMKVLDDDLKMAVVLRKCPGALRTHLQLNAQQTQKDFAAMREVIVAYCRSARVWETDGVKPMEVDAAQSWRWRPKSPPSAPPPARPSEPRRYPQQPPPPYVPRASSGSWGSAQTGKGKGKQSWQPGAPRPFPKASGPPPMQRFEGYCRSCGKWGHKAATCRVPSVRQIEEQSAAVAAAASSAASAAPAVRAAVQTSSEWVVLAERRESPLSVKLKTMICLILIDSVAFD